MTTSACSASRSVTFPLPSSPHWAPTTTSPGTSSSPLGLDAVRGRRRSVEVAFAVHVGELRIATEEREHDFTDRTVPVLGDADVRLAGSLRVAVVVLVAI